MYFFLGITLGIYVGTFYNCKPIIETIEEFFSNKFGLDRKYIQMAKYF